MGIVTGFKAELLPALAKWWTDLTAWRFLFLLACLYLLYWMFDRCKRWINARFETAMRQIEHVETLVPTRISEALTPERIARDQALRALSERLEAFMRQFPEGMGK